MGDTNEIRADFDKLRDANQNLLAEKELVQSLDLGDSPAAAVFGGSALGQSMAQTVSLAHENLIKAQDDTVQGLGKWVEATEKAQTEIMETDEGQAAIAKTMAEALQVMSNPLVMFNSKGTAAGKTMPI
ncbi:hypothetical protein FB381_0078 [Nocardioides albertanoniae]|uniref:Type VII secretion system (Wss) protein ESAT-6 n=1 Tax=Nocardioides albertanoniae TaxID=1175486 RepID=A0A543A0V6_9ACTN|nr:hypothetical protein [Nocardioides albertanoniae]TQL66229.1 hypothetical protein FB381_0078 [Nocardioides albertanoniae]